MFEQEKRDKDNANKAGKYHKMKKYKTKDLPLLLALFFVALSSFFILLLLVDESPAHYSFIIEETYKFPITLMKNVYKFKEKYIKVKQTWANHFKLSFGFFFSSFVSHGRHKSALLRVSTGIVREETFRADFNFLRNLSRLKIS